MALKTFRPLTPTNRFKTWPAFDEITKKKKPEKSLLEIKKKSGGRNNLGRPYFAPQGRRSQAEVSGDRLQTAKARRRR
jgi:ribosomal protein L2